MAGRVRTRSNGATSYSFSQHDFSNLKFINEVMDPFDISFPVFCYCYQVMDPLICFLFDFTLEGSLISMGIPYAMLVVVLGCHTLRETNVTA